MVSQADLEARLRALLDEAAALGDPAVLRALLAVVQERVAAAPAAAAPVGAADDDGFCGILGRSAPMRALFDKIRRFGPAQAPVLLTGQSGTGKEMVARALHETSPRRTGPWVAENCAAIPETLLESVLFGHQKGAFTGAVRDHQGHFAAADGGTLFLDEIGDMPLSMQVKLLRALQEGEVRPVGGSKVRKVDVRVIAATNQDLEERVKKGAFRQDLFFRLNVLRLELPLLKDRGEDVVLLARRFLAAEAKKAGRELRLSPAAEKVLLAAPWPGNVRQLQNEVQRAVALAAGPEVGPKDFSPAVRGG